jgi:hypothetical protein
MLNSEYLVRQADTSPTQQDSLVYQWCVGGAVRCRHLLVPVFRILVPRYVEHLACQARTAKLTGVSIGIIDTACSGAQIHDVGRFAW